MTEPVLQARRILKTRVDATSYRDACDRIQTWATTGRSGYVVAANVHVVMTAYWDSQYQRILEDAALVTSDGMPLVMGLRLLGVPGQSRVYGPDLMLAWCDRAAQLGLPIYLYGGTAPMLEKMANSLQQQFPGLPIAGTHAPPFRPLSAEEAADDVARINQSGARVVFVGLGCPKQEQWMHRHQSQVNAVMIGVGAAFSFFSGDVSQAPRWMMRLGLEWLYRFGQEPRRLWQRYLVNNPMFVLLFGAQVARYRLWGARASEKGSRFKV
ncbi:WecB/TagA/CpsF family glycosyltransferase [Phormidium tenue]|uniref:Glycosyltransferase n=1 Tax=Phormidium tenue NIES-30 TaxID=549789 RepID=A0A1U7J6U7_9CYAN|nr:WecB/TagA/CpsF family glycosyltransferase [Phormidium tenue]MBD2233557.1 WecB/TagA/CpsF family glycosyltransferase [Phormidium tenue FACHB-1052]OKH48663.1 glycosyltransferase [Phormidium tenue NIES-30]